MIKFEISMILINRFELICVELNEKQLFYFQLVVKWELVQQGLQQI